MAGGISRKVYYNLINQKPIISVKRDFRTKFSLEENDPFLWLVASSCTSEVKLIQLQWKILHNIYPTGTLLHKMNIRATEICEFCAECDSLCHFFVNCIIARRVWKEAENYILRFSGKIVRLDEKRVLFGILKDDELYSEMKKSQIIINKIILIGEHTISKFKFLKI